MRKKAAVAKFRYYPSTALEILARIEKTSIRLSLLRAKI
jgi:hypothetical protein